MGLELLRSSIRPLFRYTQLGNKGLRLRKQMPNRAVRRVVSEFENTGKPFFVPIYDNITTMITSLP